MTDQIVSIFGKPIAECSREELEKAVTGLVQIIDTMRDSQAFVKEMRFSRTSD